jgi:hypothetical protein
VYGEDELQRLVAELDTFAGMDERDPERGRRLLRGPERLVVHFVHAEIEFGQRVLVRGRAHLALALVDDRVAPPFADVGILRRDLDARPHRLAQVLAAPTVVVEPGELFRVDRRLLPFFDEQDRTKPRAISRIDLRTGHVDLHLSVCGEGPRKSYVLCGRVDSRP